MSDAAAPLATVFELLDRWRHFPAYQLERRADIFFAAYRPGLSKRLVRMSVGPGKADARRAGPAWAVHSSPSLQAA